MKIMIHHRGTEGTEEELAADYTDFADEEFKNISFKKICAISVISGKGSTSFFFSVISAPLWCILLLFVSGCARPTNVPALATQSYPGALHTVETADIQVFRDEDQLELVNATARSYRDFDLWINQRYVLHVDSLLAGETITLSLWDFFDERGDRFRAGGFFATREPELVRLVEIQSAPNLPMVGLIAIMAE